MAAPTAIGHPRTSPDERSVVAPANSAPLLRKLPEVLVVHALGFLSAKDLSRFIPTSRLSYHCGTAEKLWMPITKNCLHHIPPSEFLVYLTRARGQILGGAFKQYDNISRKLDELPQRIRKIEDSQTRVAGRAAQALQAKEEDFAKIHKAFTRRLDHIQQMMSSCETRLEAASRPLQEKLIAKQSELTTLLCRLHKAEQSKQPTPGKTALPPISSATQALRTQYQNTRKEWLALLHQERLLKSNYRQEQLLLTKQKAVLEKNYSKNHLQQYVARQQGVLDRAAQKLRSAQECSEEVQTVSQGLVRERIQHEKTYDAQLKLFNDSLGRERQSYQQHCVVQKLTRTFLNQYTFNSVIDAHIFNIRLGRKLDSVH